MNRTASATDNGRRTTNYGGFTLIEIIIAVFLIALIIVPLVSAFGPALFSTSGEEETAVFTNQVRGTLSRVMNLDFQTLDNNQGNPVNLVTLFGSAAEAAKETFSYQGKSHTPTVAISDVSGGNGGLLEVTVTMDHVSLKTMKADY